MTNKSTNYKGEYKDSQSKKDRVTTAIGIGQTVHVQIHGDASSQMIQAYQGQRFNSDGSELQYNGRSLKGISEYKINSDYESRNISQQSGFDAELLQEARDNRDNILNGNTNRVRTTDDVGTTNDTKVDLVSVDKNGNIIDGTGIQVKFYGNEQKVVDKIVKDLSWDRYDSIMIPADQYDGALAYAEKQASEYRKQAEVLRQKGCLEKAFHLEDKARRYENAKLRLRKSKVSRDEAIQARKNPEKFVAENVAGDCLNAGLQSMKYAAIVGGLVAVAQNTAALINGQKDLSDAALDVVDSTADSAFSGLFVGTSGTAVKSLMHTAKSELIRRLGTTSAPVLIATGVMDVTKSFISFAKGEIDTLQLFEQLGEKGVCSVASGIGASIGGGLGTLIGPAGTIVGGVIGGMASYTICSTIYNNAIGLINDARYTRERRTEIEKICDEAFRTMHEYQSMSIKLC